MKNAPPAFRRLATQVLFFLTIALLPIGIVGVVQNERLVNEVQQRAELSLLALSEQALSGERQLMQQAFGAADALGRISTNYGAGSEECRSQLRAYVEADDEFVFAGFVDSDGLVRCSSVDRILDFSQSAQFDRLMADPMPFVGINLDAPGSQQAVIIVSQPRYQGDELVGFTSLSLPLRDVGQSEDFLGDANPVALVTFNVQGDVLSSESMRQVALAHLPADIALQDLAKGDPRTFEATSNSGADLLYNVVPIKPGVVYAMAVWETDTVAALTNSGEFSSVLPILMWMLSLGVVWLVIDRLVINGIQRLNRNMIGFAEHRSFGKPVSAGVGSVEMEQLDTSFRTMAETIIAEEADLENRLHEKNVLLKEVHHRVKNNLQIVSSIMNIQMHKANADETKAALKQVQERIIGLSGVHRTLYQAENLSHVNAAILIRQIVDQTKALGLRPGEDLRIETDLTDMRLFPDQAIPLSMWVAEALTNALKYGRTDASPIKVVLRLDDDRNAMISVTNEIEATVDRGVSKGSGLGSQLIRAFAFQLDGETETIIEGGLYQVSVTFEITEFQAEPADY